jgi:hypothetical protein
METNRRNGRVNARPLAEVVAEALSPALAAQGFAGREVIARWGELVGDRLAARARPLRIDWPKRRPGAAGDATETATLVVLVESAFAPEMQHAGPLLMTRINALLGWPAVGRLALRQGPVKAADAPQAAAPALTTEEQEAVIAAAAPVETPGLRDAVARLGLAVRQRQKASG